MILQDRVEVRLYQGLAMVSLDHAAIASGDESMPSGPMPVASEVVSAESVLVTTFWIFLLPQAKGL